MPLTTLLQAARAHGANVRHALALGVGAILLAPVSRAWRAKIAAARMASDHPFALLETELSRFLSPDLPPVLVGPVASAHANVSEAELLAICALVVQLNARRVFEIGTYDGRTTLAMARNVGPGAHVYTLNLPPDFEGAHVPADDAALARVVPSGARFRGTPEAARITQLWGDSSAFDFSTFRGTMDLVFIDGAHTAEFVEGDTRTARSLIRVEGGLVLWHDATRYGVVEYLERAVYQDGLPLRVIRGTSLGVAAVEGGHYVDALDWLASRGGDT
jgi:predicted O-methyltransferase YrrM